MTKSVEINAVLQKYREGEINRDDAFETIVKIIEGYNVNSNISITEDVKVNYEFVPTNKK